MARFFFADNGDYLGVFDGEGALATLPEGAIEVFEPPAHGFDRLIDGVIVPYVPPIDVEAIIQGTASIITQGQATMAQAPLPEDIQEQIFDLEVFVANYLRRNAFQIARNKINAFVVDPNRNDVSAEQHALIGQLKAQILSIIP